MTSTTKGLIMISTNRTPIRTRVGQCLAATALMAGLAIGAAANAAADREWDIATYDWCMKQKSTTAEECCILSDGDWKNGKCQSPAPLQNQPGQTAAPPVLQNPPGQTVAPPVITAPRAPGGDTLG
jgi:hypothetical protein